MMRHMHQFPKQIITNILYFIAVTHTICTKKVKSSLRSVTNDLVSSASNSGIKLIPGQKICTLCRKRLNDSVSDEDNDEIYTSVPEVDFQQTSNDSSD